MKTVILCGGYGTRIRDVADDIPKPMIPIGGKPILCLGYKSEIIKDFFINYELRNADIMVTLGKKAEKVLTGTQHDEDGSEYLESIRIVKWLILCNIFGFISYPAGMLLVAKERLKHW